MKSPTTSSDGSTGSPAVGHRVAVAVEPVQRGGEVELLLQRAAHVADPAVPSSIRCRIAIRAAAHVVDATLAQPVDGRADDRDRPVQPGQRADLLVGRGQAEHQDGVHPLAQQVAAEDAVPRRLRRRARL